MTRFAALLAAFALTVTAAETVDLSVANRIKAEAFQNSQVMDHLFYLTDVYGPRLTDSPGHRAAAEFVVKRLKEYGLQNVKLEKWGPFGQSWRLTHFSASLLEPQYMPLIGFPLAWTPGTDGNVTGEPVLAIIHNEADFDKYRGKLKGKIVLTMEPKQIEMITEPMARRLTDQELIERENTADPSRFFRGPGGGGRGGTPIPTPAEREAAAKLRAKTNQFFKDEGVLVVLQYGTNGDGGTVFATSGGSRNPKDPIPPPMVAVTPEHYNRIARLVQHNIPVKLEFDIRTEFINDSPDSFNVVGEIPGTTKKDELVMLGAHLDSWHGATGATDNGTGSSVAIEAVRILEALKLPMARTVRIALWSGEEEGLLGSIAYVQEHFARRDTMQLGPEYNKLSAYYNDDTGTGKFRGISAGGNDMVVPIFQEWLQPFHDLGAIAVVGATAPPTRQPGGTDHTSFTWIGLPGFGFLQDPMEYGTRTHHSNMDFYDRVQPGDVMQASAIMAWFVYNTATRPEMMPRLPMPKPTKQETASR
ncbi:MAG TPA: M28 family peptidase [Bryobacteraceae bacterium]|nr:M28 family peptidase [Bryobacteraceae bacterium]